MHGKQKTLYAFLFLGKKMPLFASLAWELQQDTQRHCCWGGGKGIKQESGDSLSRLEAVFQHVTNLIILVLLSSFLFSNL